MAEPTWPSPDEVDAAADTMTQLNAANGHLWPDHPPTSPQDLRDWAHHRRIELTEEAVDDDNNA